MVRGHKEEINSQSSGQERKATDASEDALELYEGGNAGRYTSRQDIAYDDDYSQGSQDEEEPEQADVDNEQLKPNLQFNNYA